MSKHLHTTLTDFPIIDNTEKSKSTSIYFVKVHKLYNVYTNNIPTGSIFIQKKRTLKKDKIHFPILNKAQIYRDLSRKPVAIFTELLQTYDIIICFVVKTSLFQIVTFYHGLTTCTALFNTEEPPSNLSK